MQYTLVVKAKDEAAAREQAGELVEDQCEFMELTPGRWVIKFTVDLAIAAPVFEGGLNMVMNAPRISTRVVDEERGELMLHFLHRWTPVRADPYDQLFTFTRGPKAGETINIGDMTVVLERCACGKTRTRQLEGVWTLEDLTKEVVR